MHISNTGLSNMSYTNKDFNSIYNELLDLADRISPNWKPSQSHESDPGVVLLKLDAIIGDKNNYNIDKNVLELFPSSVTQYPAAREIFNQCGYKMPYYQAAEVIVSLNLFKEPEDVINAEATTGDLRHEDTKRLYTLDNFTMLTNSDSSVVYTIVDTYPFLTSDSTTYEYKALEGIIKEYNINNSNKITYDNLDYNNRLYFKESNIAENGIFIQNISNGEDKQNWTDWRLVDNLLVEPLNSTCYSFGLSKDGSTCYIEFPSDIANLIGDGLKINYITTSGYKGNISEYTLNNFFSSVNSYVSKAEDTLSYPSNRYNSNNVITEDSSDTPKLFELTSDNVYIRNIKYSINGKDPETIEEAYRNYERTKNTFNTLVSLRDYNNFLLTSDQVSNGFVCDRSNDIQASTKIITTLDGTFESLHNQVSGTSNPDMNAFDLKIYALKYIDPVDNSTKFDLSFSVASSTYINNLKDDMDDTKCIQHDFKDIDTNKPHHIELRYPIYAKIIPYNRLETLQQLEIQSTIIKNLQKGLNAKEISFGEGIDYDYVYDIIMNSDTRIKSLILDDFDYEAYIVYLDDDGNSQSLPIPSQESLDDLISGMNKDASAAGYINPTSSYTSSLGISNQDAAELFNTIRAKSILAGNTPLFENPEYDFKLSTIQRNHALVKDCGKVTTNTGIIVPFSDNKFSFKLLDNESLYLTIDNYITKDTYANYCKYFYKLNTDVNKDAIRELEGSGLNAEYIAFFWKESDEASYSYKIYTPDTAEKVISPSFKIDAALTGNAASTDEDAYTQVHTGIKALIDAQKYEGTLDIASLPITAPTTSQVAECNDNNINILSGTKSIAIKDSNTVTFNKSKGHKLYWILNQTDLDGEKNPVYRLFKVNGPKSYILKNGEYLFYSDSKSSIFAMLGAGTRLNYDTTSIQMPYNVEVKVKSYEEVMYGLNNLLDDENLWYNITKESEIAATEMIYYNIGSGSEVTLTYGGSETPTNLNIDNDSISIGGSEGSDPIYLRDFTISYNYEGNDVSLPSINTSGTDWKGYSMLNLDCGPGKEQELINNYEDKDNSKALHTQSVIPTYKLIEESDGSYSFESLSGQSPISPNSASSIKIQSAYDINTLGGQDIDISAYFLTGARENNAFISYAQEAATSVKTILPDHILKITLNTSSSNSSGTISINIPNISGLNANYILPILTNKQYKNATIKTGSESGTALSTINGAALKDQGLHFYSIPSGTTALYISLTNEDQDQTTQTSFNILPFIAYTNESVLKLTSASAQKDFELIEVLKTLDANNKYNYAHIVDNDVLIEDPLDPDSFLDKNHPYNQYSICRWDYKNSTVKVTNKIK